MAEAKRPTRKKKEPEPEPEVQGGNEPDEEFFVAEAEVIDPTPTPNFVAFLLELRPVVAETLADPDLPDILKVPLSNIKGDLSHLADALHTWRSLYREDRGA